MTNVSLLIVFVCLLSTALTSDAEKLIRIHEAFESRIADMGIPGGAFAVIHDNVIVGTRASGYATESTVPFTSSTYVCVGSITKSMTALLIQQLIDEGKLNSWKDVVSTILPTFQMNSDILTNRMTLSDLIHHRSGLGANSGQLPLMSNPILPLKTVAYTLKHYTPLNEFRGDEGFLYNNAAYSLAGYVVEYIEAEPYTQVVKNRLGNLLNLDIYFSGASAVADGKTVTTSYFPGGTSIPYQLADTIFGTGIAPAGAAHLSINELAKYTRALTSKDSSLLSSIAWSDYFIVRNHANIPPINFPGLDITIVGYSAGLFKVTINGHTCYQHAGTSTTASLLLTCPELGFGAVAINNFVGGRPANDLAVYSAFKEFVLNEQVSLVPVPLESPDSPLSDANPLQCDPTRPPSFPASSVDLEYTHPYYGSLSLTIGTSLTLGTKITYNSWEMPLEHCRDGLFQATSMMGDQFAFEFKTEVMTNRITSIHMFVGNEQAIFKSSNFFEMPGAPVPSTAPQMPRETIAVLTPSSMISTIVFGGVVGLVCSLVVLVLFYVLFSRNLSSKMIERSNPLAAIKL
ncbi:hypothetical protein RCL1_001345 [Eukaryota sp. TZLM3-RCL]